MTETTGAEGRLVLAARSHAEEKRIRYLLGLCSEAERERLESEYFQNEDAFQEMLTAEDDLIDAYARGELTDQERRRFEKRFLTSSGGTDRVRFARAFTGAVFVDPPLEIRQGALLEMGRGWPAALRVGTIAFVIVLVTVLSWLLLERKRMSNELRNLGAAHEDLGKRADELRRSADGEQLPSGDATMLLENLRPGLKTDTKRESRVPIMTDRHRIDSGGDAHGKRRSFIDEAASLRIGQTAILGRRFEDLLTLTPRLSIPLFALPPRSTTSAGRTTVDVPRSLYSIKLWLRLDTPAQPREYRAAIETAAGRRVKSFSWMEPLRPNRDSIITPEITTIDLPSDDYQLLLAGTDANGSFVRVAEYSFTIVRN